MASSEICFDSSATSTQQPWHRNWQPEITEMNRNGGKYSPRFRRRLYFSTDSAPLNPKLYANLPSSRGSGSVSILLAKESTIRQDTPEEVCEPSASRAR